MNNVVEFPHSDTYAVILGVSEIMERRFTREQIELGARVAFFSALAIDQDGQGADLVPGVEEVAIEWVENWLPRTYPYKLIRAHARVRPIETPQEG